MKDWKDYPTDPEYWEKELPESENVPRIMQGTTSQYVSQLMKLGEKKLFKILGNKYGFEDFGDGQKLYDYYPITDEDIRKYG